MPNPSAGIGAQRYSNFLGSPEGEPMRRYHNTMAEYYKNKGNVTARESAAPTTRVVADSVSGNFNAGNVGNRFDKARNDRVQSFIQMVDYRNSKQAPMYAYGMNPSLNRNFRSYSISSIPAMR